MCEYVVRKLNVNQITQLLLVNNKLKRFLYSLDEHNLKCFILLSYTSIVHLSQSMRVLRQRPCGLIHKKQHIKKEYYIWKGKRMIDVYLKKLIVSATTTTVVNVWLV